MARIHTDLTVDDFWQALRKAPVSLEIMEHGSRTHKRAFELQLTGSGGRRNTGTRGASDERGATWDEWGSVLGAIFSADPTARMGGSKNPTYRDGAHFAEVTGDRFENGRMPSDTHPRHRWQGDRVYGFECSKCSAVWRP